MKSFFTSIAIKLNSIDTQLNLNLKLILYEKNILHSTSLILSIVFINSCHPNKQQSQIEHNICDKIQCVPDEGTAKKIAEAVWLPIYGEEIHMQKPYKAILEDSVWIVEGVLPEGIKGGSAYIEIRRKDCKVLKITHGK